MSGRGGRVASAIVTLCLLCSCVGPARTTGAYEGKAAHTAQAALSQMRAALLAVDAAHRKRLTQAYLETLLSECEDAFSSIQATFDSIQPPNTTTADDLRAKLDPLLTSGSDGLAQLRILARRQEVAALNRLAGQLASLADQLDAFGTEHAG